ncbi:MAG: DUF364 domain-containing protein [bacterium]|jgi:uncharacterized protein (DUF4213/DUF364 family)|nr:DUF364 domain-containing protein [Bacillota bacterium]HHW54727.1 DUF364 domain-containing protein [Bacillota bacterium]
MLAQKVLETAKEYLAGKRIKDAVIGLSLIAIQLDDDSVGISYMLREHLPAGCSAFPYGREILGKPAGEVAEWVLTGREDAQKGIGMAVLTAASHSQDLQDVDEAKGPFGLDLSPTDVIGMIGYVKPVARELQKRTRKVIIFDWGQSVRGGHTGLLAPMEEQPKLLPECDVVFLSGTTVTNGTVDELLKMCPKAREVVMLGPSTPMFPAAFRDTPITVLAGSWWKSRYKEKIFKDVSLACGISHLREYMIKKAVAVG